MSLIHDALKKAQKPDAEAPTKDFPQFLKGAEELASKSQKNIRLIVLVVLLVGALTFLVYQKFFAAKSTSAPQTEVAEKVKSAATGGEVGRLKGEAIKAYRSNRIEDAWLRLSTANQLEPQDPEILNNMGLILKRRGEFVEARDYFERAIALKPECSECYNNLAILDMNQGETEKASEGFSKALSINPNYADAMFHLGILAERNGNTSDAITYYKKFLNLAKDAPHDLTDNVRNHVVSLETE